MKTIDDLPIDYSLFEIVEKLYRAGVKGKPRDYIACPAAMKKIHKLFVSIIGEALPETYSRNKAYKNGFDDSKQQFLNNLREKGLEVGKE